MKCFQMAVTRVQALFRPNDTREVCSRCANALMATKRWAEIPNSKFTTGITFCQGIPDHQ